MKHSNLVVGEKVQVKRTHVCSRGDTYKAGKVYTVYRIDDDGEFWMQYDDSIGGKGINVPENFRKYKEPEQEPQQEVAYQYKVGDKVVVGAEGAGYGCVLPDYAGKVCTVVGVRVHGTINLVMITHPDVMNGSVYTSMLKYLTPHKPEPEPLKVGDIVELSEDCTARHGEAIPKGLYRLHKQTGSAAGHTNLATEHGGLGQATVKTELLTKVGVCINPNG